MHNFSGDNFCMTSQQIPGATILRTVMIGLIMPAGGNHIYLEFLTILNNNWNFHLTSVKSLSPSFPYLYISSIYCLSIYHLSSVCHLSIINHLCIFFLCSNYNCCCLSGLLNLPLRWFYPHAKLSSVFNCHICYNDFWNQMFGSDTFVLQVPVDINSFTI